MLLCSIKFFFIKNIFLFISSTQILSYYYYCYFSLLFLLHQEWIDSPLCFTSSCVPEQEEPCCSYDTTRWSNKQSGQEKTKSANWKFGYYYLDASVSLLLVSLPLCTVSLMTFFACPALEKMVSITFSDFRENNRSLWPGDESKISRDCK